MGYRYSERRFTPCALDIDVDPLVVAGRFRKSLDSLLRNLQPVTNDDFQANFSGQVIQIAEHRSRHPALLWAAMYRNQGMGALRIAHCALRIAIRAGTISFD